jgi:hypothetical protein
MKRLAVRGTLETLACVVAGAALGCAKLAGVDDYATSNGDHSREAVAAFLGGGACGACIEDACRLEVDACSADNACSAPAACMARCQSRNQQAGDPACVIMECAGASLPTNGALLDLSACAKSACSDQCQIGRSWACSGKYDWPRVPATPFVAAYQIGIFDSLEHFGDRTVRLCDRRSPLPACEGTTCCLWPRRTRTAWYNCWSRP